MTTYNQEGIEKIQEIVDNTISFVLSYEYGQTNGRYLSKIVAKELKFGIIIFLDQAENC